MLPISANDRISFTPPGAEAIVPKPVFYIAAPTPRSRAALRRAVAEEGLVHHPDSVLYESLREGVAALVEDGQQKKLLAIIDKYEAVGREAAEADLQADFDRVEKDVSARYRPYRALVAERREYLDMLPYMMNSRFIAGWEGQDVEYENIGGLVPHELLEKLDTVYRIQVWVKITSLMGLDAATRKNSASRSPSPSGRKSSAAAPEPPTAAPGKSSGSSTSKTPASA